MKTKINEIQWPENQLAAKIKFQFNEINRPNVILLHNYHCHSVTTLFEFYLLYWGLVRYVKLSIKFESACLRGREWPLK